MATARELPMEDYNANPTITIGADLTPSPQACMVSGSGQMSVTFANASGQAIEINFVPPAIPGNPVLFSSITSFPDTQDIPARTNASVNYYVTANGEISGPWCIQINDGPMIVMLTLVNSAMVYTPATVAVPETGAAGDGTLAIFPALNGFPIAWLNNNDPFTPPINQSDGASHASNPGTAGNTYSYTAGHSPNDQPGGGKVIITST